MADSRLEFSVERAQRGEIADLGRQRGEPVLGQDQFLQVREVTDLGRKRGQMAFAHFQHFQRTKRADLGPAATSAD